MMPPQQKTLAERARAIADKERFQAKKAREIVNELLDTVTALECGSDISDALESIDNVVNALEQAENVGIPVDVTVLRNLLVQFQEGMPEADALTALVDAWNGVNEVLVELEGANQPDSDYDQDEKAELRQAGLDAMSELADALEVFFTPSVEPAEPVESE